MPVPQYQPVRDVSVEWYTDCDDESYWIFKFYDPNISYEGSHWFYTGGGYTEEETREMAKTLFGEEVAKSLIFK